MKAIKAYERKSKLSVYYQFYNPWTIPFVQRVPVAGYTEPAGELSVGTRIIPAKSVHQRLLKKRKGHRPTLHELGEALQAPFKYGWPLDHFVSNLFMGCHEGSEFDNISDDRVQNLFYRRTGPIAAAIAITIEAP